jgi:alkanesulfonate monooxygenase SsuD/methylene tetrahydromethanopterin reductase-like flavin-dependent oxidoreductase (luciferase family)
MQKGDFAAFDKLMFAPKPAQRRGLPIWVGGESKGARRRAARLGDGWYPVSANPHQPLDTPELYGAALADVRAEADATGRDPHSISAALLAIYSRVGPELESRDGGRLCFTGSAEAIVDDIGRAHDLGLEHFLIGGDGGDLQETGDRLEQFATEVMTRFD